jgi:hypothetical protein
MSNYLIPADDAIIEVAAKAICRNRMRQDADHELKSVFGQGLDDLESFDQAFERIFEQIWAGKSEYDELQRTQYRDDARAVISAINLKLLITE